MITIKTIVVGLILGVAASIPVVYMLLRQPATPAAMTAPASTKLNKPVTPQEDDTAATVRRARLAEAGIDVETLAILQECRKGWKAQASEVENVSDGRSPQNLK